MLITKCKNSEQNRLVFFLLLKIFLKISFIFFYYAIEKKNTNTNIYRWIKIAYLMFYLVDVNTDV